MSELSLERLRREGEAFMEALSREYYEAGAGFKATAALAPIYARHSALFDDESLAMVREMFREASEGSAERRAARILLEWLTESRASRMLAALDEREIAWEAAAVAELDDGRQLEYQRVPIEIANATDRAERHRLERARAALVARELAPLKRERLARERELVEELDLAEGYNAAFTLLTGIDLGELAEQCRGFLRDTQAMWDDVHPEFVRRSLGIAPDEATRADALALLRAHEFDAGFPAATMEDAVRRQVREMGIDPEAGGRVIHDTVEREGKRARAFCAPVRVPDEVYLVLRPHGGASDWMTLLHELGHALHFGYARADLPFEYRWLGDNSVTESYAMLFDHRLKDRGWLRRYAALNRARLPAYLRAAGFEELHFLRRYAGKLLYEMELYGGTLTWDELPGVYVDTLSAATSFRYSAADAFVDVDPRYYSARYLRAWQLQAVLAEALVERFDQDWWRNPRAGPWIAESLFGEGQRETAAELGARVGGRSLSFAPLVRCIERMLETTA